MNRRTYAVQDETKPFRFIQVNVRRTPRTRPMTPSNERPRIEGDREQEILDATLEVVPDTGTLREDLREVFCGMGGLADPQQIAIFSSIITAIGHDAEFAEAFRRDVIGAKIAASRAVWERAKARGELRAGLDVDVIEPALAGIVLHRVFVMGEKPSAENITAVIDQIILPAATCG